MRSQILFLAFALTVSLASASSRADEAFKSVDFETAGGIRARADVYDCAPPTATWIVLFHQAGWSRGEYREIAPTLVKKGHCVMAVDQRSGRAVKGVTNETHQRAKRKKLSTEYVDAYADLEAALRYAHKELRARRVVVWGSSYSASLVLRLAAEHADDVDAVMSFSPGEYFERQGAHYIRAFAERVKQPLFVTSSKNERAQVEPIFDASPSDKKVLFTPASRGQHGSRALWSRWPDNDVYWAAVNGFLESYVPPKPSAN